MMWEWLRAGRRIAALEAELAALRDAARAEAARIAGRDGEIGAALAEAARTIREQGARLDEALASLDPRLSDAEDRLGRLERDGEDDALAELARDAKARDRELQFVRSTLASLERQLQAQARDASTAATALLARLDQVRAAGLGA